MPRKKYTEEFVFEQVDTPAAREQTDWAEEVMKLNIWIVVGTIVAHTLITGCAAGGGAPAVIDSECDQEFSPDPQLVELTAEVLNVWSEATGRNLCITDNGIPIMLQDYVLDLDGDQLCGNTSVDYFHDTSINYITISADLDGICLGQRQTLTHEIGHAIGRTPLGDAMHLDNNLYGVMSERPNSLLIPNRHDIELVCRRTDCWY